MLKYSEVPDTAVENVRVSYGRALPCCRRKSRINHHKGGFGHLYYFILLIRAWYSNELPELEVANSRRTGVAPDRRQAMLMPRSGLRRRVSLVARLTSYMRIVLGLFAQIRYSKLVISASS